MTQEIKQTTCRMRSVSEIIAYCEVPRNALQGQTLYTYCAACNASVPVDIYAISPRSAVVRCRACGDQIDRMT